MAVQVGRWNFDGRPVERQYLNEVAALLSSFEIDGRNSLVAASIGFLFLPFHTTAESRRETQPHVSRSGDVITWDGILDNRKELVKELGLAVPEEFTDLSIVEAAWERWGTDCFAKLIGDWALAIWKPSQQTLLLVKDFVGTRHLHYFLREDYVAWSTALDPLVLLAGYAFHLNEDYLAGWLSHFPSADATPFIEIRAVPPSSYIQIRNGRMQITKYWDFNPSRRISYQSDNDYEEHFLKLIETSILRRLRSDAPILAELSGGMDSSSIVCVADKLLAQGKAPGTRIDTVSYYQDGEPAWDERPYIGVVEKTRGKAGCHIDVSAHTLLNYGYDPDRPELTPVSRGAGSEPVQRLARYIASNKNRVLLSGFAGDEVLGGAPDVIPQLADLFATARIAALARQLKAWALSNRTTVISLLVETLRAFFITRSGHAAPWINAKFVAAHRAAFSRYQVPFALLGSMPSFQDKLWTVGALRRQLASFSHTLPAFCEKRYPYLDRDLMEFLFAIPAEQLQRPGRRRSLMRRALVGIVPDEVLNRKRKAFMARQSLVDITSYWPDYCELIERSLLVGLHIIDRDRLFSSLKKAKAGNMIPLPPLAHAVVLEKWLRNLQPHGFISSLSTCLAPNGAARDFLRQQSNLS
jgi:asparagine synthase (glutamine-hydrolysing)